MNSLHPRSSGLLVLIAVAFFAGPATSQLPAISSRVLTVDSVIAIAQRENPRVGAAGAALSAARGGRLTSGRWTNPTLTYQVENTGFPGQASPTGLDRETSAFAMIPLEPAYQLRSRVAISDAQVRAARADLTSVRHEITRQAVEAFYSTALAQVEVDALDENRAWADSLIRYTGSRAKEGAAAEVDLIRLEVERDRAQTDLALSQVDLVRSRAALAALIGSDDFTISISRPGAITPVPAPLLNVQTLLADARKASPAIASADARVDAATSGVSLERKSLLRELALMAGVKSTAGTRSMMTGVSFSLPVFDQNRGEIQRAEAGRRIAEFDRETARRGVVADVTATASAVNTLSAQLDRMQDGLIRRAEEARRIAEGAYREGATPLTQVLDAARALTEARRLYYRALFARDQALFELRSSLGEFDSGKATLNDGSAR